MLKFFYIIIISLLFLTNSLYSIEESKIPSSLIEWKDWVLDDIEDRECPIEYQTGIPKCSWYNDISVALNGQQLDFNMSVTLYRDKTKVTLPSAHLAWVKDVFVNGKKAIVLDSKSKAILILDKGTHTITGSIPWRENLKYLQLPHSVALVNLYKNDKKISSTSVDQNSRLWLDKTGSTNSEKGTLSVSIYRKVVDGHPLRMQSYLHFSVSGKMRSVILDGILLDKFLPTAISGSLDATVTEDKKLKVEVKAGEWGITIDSYTPYNLTRLQKPKGEFIYANQEVWTLQTNPNYRTIEIEGAIAIDPAQTTLPKGWRSLPAYLVTDELFVIKELYKSAKQQQKNEFRLKRQIWLDFDGKGYTISDKINAKISEVRRLEATAVLDLASVSINAKPTLITTLGDTSQKGVELRKENLKIEASSRYEGDISLPPASGWDEKFDSVNTTLHLPAGWKLFASFGSDGRGSGWIDKWNLMDIFLVLLLGIAIYQLYGWRWSAPATLFIILLWHESDAPTIIWLFVLVLVALLRVLEEGRLRKVLKVLMAIVVAITVLEVLQFSVHEIRTALYPQLEKDYYSDSFFPPVLSASVDEEDSMVFKKDKSISYRQRNMSVQESFVPVKKVSKSQNEIMQNRIDPNAVVQTGIGKPAWSWNTHQFSWQSAVGSDEWLELWLISPTLSKVLKVLHIIGMLFLLYMFLHEFVKNRLPRLNLNGAKVLSILLLLTLSSNTLRADIPSDKMLEELKNKLTVAPTCLPHCATIESVEVDIADDILKIKVDISAGANISVPIFGNRNRWLPSSVMIDNKRANLNIDSGGLSIMLEKGVHEVILSGSLIGHEQIMLSSTLALHNLKSLSTNKSWQISTDYKSYIEINNLKEQKEKEQEKSRIEPMVQVSRTLYFGQRWYIDTEVKLLNHIDKPHRLLYILLPNESILDKEIELKDGKAVLHLDSKNSNYHWRSSIPITESLELNFAKDSQQIEIWQMDISSIWDITYEGIEPIEQLKVGDILMPRFKPWQGDKLKLTMQRAKAVRGKSLTIESSRLEIVQSGRYRDMRLNLNLKSSKAGQYTITIDGAEKLNPTQIDGKSHYLKINNGKVSIPLKAKAQKVKLSWREEIGATDSYRFPHIDLNSDSVNSSIHLTLPYNRWVLWTDGPTIGPAVLLWGVLLAVLLFALILGRVKGTPLKTRDWLLLGLGVSTTSVFIMLPVVMWIFALRFKEQKGFALKGWLRNFTQIGLVILTFIALGTIIGAVSAGLLGNPDMMIVGNDSYGYNLNWYSDRISTATIAEPTVISVSIWYYRALMLLWAIWIAFSLIGWLKWAWAVFSEGDIWSKDEKKGEGEVE